MSAADHCNLGSQLGQRGRIAQAAEQFALAIALDPNLPEAHANLAHALSQLGRLEEAIASASRAVALRPDFRQALFNLGNLLWQAGRPAEATEYCRRAAALAPRDPEAQNALGIALRQQGALAEAAACGRRAIGLRPSYGEAHFNLGVALLALGELAEGWAEDEWRWATPELQPFRRNFSQPQWQGENAAGRTLLLHAEQGLGDTLQFCRYAMLAAGRGLSVVLEVQEPLARLLRSLPGGAKVVARGEKLPPFDLFCPLLSAPLAFGTTLDSVPSATCYLRADPARAEAWRARLPGGLRVGLAWAGNPRSQAPGATAIDRLRSIAPARLAPIAEVRGVTLVSLQMGGPAAPFSLFDAMTEMADFANTATLVEALDLVITVDTAVAHLAGALGKPVWLLDRFDHCWRWLAGRRDSPWYPTMRIYRQSRPGDWDSVLVEVVRDLRALAG